jgi:hypothetical protein
MKGKKTGTGKVERRQQHKCHLDERAINGQTFIPLRVSKQLHNISLDFGDLISPAKIKHTYIFKYRA